MKILVTGGAGYIGSHLVDYLIKKGHKVITLDNYISGSPKNTNIEARSFKGDIRVTESNSNQNILEIDQPIILYRGLRSFLESEKPEIIFHLAAVSRTPWAIEDPMYTYETNVVGSANVLEAARQAGVKKVVLASSNIVYAAQTPYKTSKLAMEQVARDYNDLYDLPTVCLRFSNVAGGDVTRQHPNNVLSSLAKSKKETGRITITGDGTQTRNFTNVSNICEALWLASQADVRGTEIDIMNPKVWELNEIAKMFNCPIDYVEDRKGDIKHLKMGIGPDKAKELLGFEAKIDLVEYINSYVNLK